MPDYDQLAAQYGATIGGGKVEDDKYDQLAKQLAGNAPTAQAAPSNSKPLSRLEKVGRGMMDPFDGGAQLLANALPDSVRQAGDRFNNWLADKTGLVARLPEGGIDQQVREKNREYEARRAAGGESGFDGYRTIGNVLSPANVGLAAGAPAAATLAGRVAVGAGTGAISGGLTPVGEGDFVSEKIKQVGYGAGLGGAVPVVAGAIGRVISPNASRNANLQLLRSEGVRPTIGQTLGGVANKIEERMTSLPIMGDMIAKARTGANSQFESAAFNRALKPLGQKLPDGLAGRDAVAYTENVLSQSYDEVLGKIGVLRPDDAFNNKVSELQGMVRRLVMPKAEKAKFDAALADVSASMDGNRIMTSDAYKALESSLGSDARKLGASQNIYEVKLAPAVKQLQAELRAMLQRQAGQHADELKSVNAGWANFKRVQKAASALGADEGSFTPAQFQNAVRAMDRSKDKGAFARGSALGQDLSDAGKSVLGSKVPNSGTPERMWMNIGAVGSGAISPAIPLGLAAGAGLYTSPAQRLLGKMVASRHRLAQPTADFFRKTSPALVPAGAQLGLRVLEE